MGKFATGCRKMLSVRVFVNECAQAYMCDRAVKLGEEDVGRSIITVGKQDETTSAVF